MMRALLGLTLLLAALWVSAPVMPGTARIAAQAAKPTDTDKFFTDDKVYAITLEIAEKELQALRRDPRRYAKATLKANDKTWKDVGIHVKGAAGSWRGIDDKPGLTLNMDKFEKGQRFYGMDKFHLANSVQDPSYLSELICGEMMRKAGVPASRIAHATVTINGKKRGLYYFKEGYDKIWLKRNFKSNDGNFYDGGFLRDIDQPLQLISTKSDVKNYADLKALIAACQEKKHDERYAKLEKLLDLDKFISFLCLEVITWDWDGYPMKCNNYRVYHDPKSNKITFIPSGMDQMFADTNGTLFPWFQGMVARGLLETPKGRDRYLDRMREILKKEYDVDALTKRLDDLQKRIQPALAALDAGAGRDFPNQVNRLKQAIKARAKNIDEQLKRLKK